jgi:hydroxylamine reductase
LHLEQIAAAFLLTLLDMGVKNVRFGPSLPAYITWKVLNVLLQNSNTMLTTNAKDDIKNMMLEELCK